VKKFERKHFETNWDVQRPLLESLRRAVVWAWKAGVLVGERGGGERVVASLGVILEFYFRWEACCFTTRIMLGELGVMNLRG